jgi:hypothetical protein
VRKDCTTNAWDQTVRLRISTTSTASARLTATGGAAGAANTLNQPLNSAVAVDMVLIGHDETTGDVAVWTAGKPAPYLVTQGVNQALVSVKGSPVFTAGTNTGGGCVAGMALPTIVTDTTNGGEIIAVVPGTSASCRFVASVHMVQIQ